MKKTILKLIAICSVLSISTAQCSDDTKVSQNEQIAITPFKLTIEKEGEKEKVNLSVNEKGELSNDDEIIAKLTSSGQILGKDGNLLAKIQNENLVDKNGNIWTKISKDGTLISKGNKKYKWSDAGVMALGDRGEFKARLTPKDSNFKQMASAVILLYFAQAPESNKK